MEYRIMLDYAGQMDVIDRVMKGEDLHAVTAELLGVKRDTAKTLNFAILYGTGADALAAMLGCTAREAKSVKTKYFRGLPQVRQLLWDIKSVGERRGYIDNRFGRRYRCADLRMSYKLPNYLIQGTGADVIKYAMVEIATLLKGARTKMVLQVHDELLFYLAPGEEYLIERIQFIMEQTYPSFNGMRLKTDVGISDKSWGDIE
jgi:DNA polymerase-1